MREIQIFFNRLPATVFFIGLSLYALGQGTGTITGKITDKDSGEPLIGVTVLIKGTLSGSITDVQGHYLLGNVPAGIYTILVKYIGYQPKSISGIEVKADAAASLNIVMDMSSSQKLNEVIVTSSYKQESVNALYAAQKSNPVISDGISADLIKRSPDKNTGAVLKRISGTSIINDKFVVVRGLAERYNETMMNGAVLPSTEPDKKAFSFNIIPASLLDKVAVYKTAAPDLPGNFSGGVIRIVTKDFPDRRFLEASLGMAYNTLTTFRHFKKPSTGGRYDLLGFEDGSRALPEAYKKVKLNYINLPIKEQEAISRQFPNTFGTTGSGSSLPAINGQVTLGDTHIFANNDKFGYLASVNYGTGHNISFRDRYDYNISQGLLYRFNDKLYRQGSNLGALLNLAWSSGRNKLALKDFFSNDFNITYTDREGAYVESGAVTRIKSSSAETVRNSLFNTVLEGEHSLDADRLSVSWNVSYGRAYRNQPDQRILEQQKKDPQDPYVVFLSNYNNPAIQSAGRVYSKLGENIYGGNLSFSLPFKLFGEQQKFKAGYTSRYRHRDYSIDALGYATSGFGPVVIQMTDGVTPGNIFNAAHLEQYGLMLSVIPNNSYSYSASAGLNAGFLMLDNKFGTSWRLVWGGRIESFRQSLIPTSDPGSKQSYRNVDILPSLNLTFAVTEKANLRGSFSQTVNRPEFREVADYSYYDFVSDYNVTGNRNLKRSISSNIDLRYEYYPAAGEIMAVSLFYKRFNNPIEQTNDGNKTFSFENAAYATDYGIEAEWRKKLDFIGGSGFWRNLIFHTNASLIVGNVKLGNTGATQSRPLQGQSPYLVNAGMSYTTDKPDLSFSLLYNRTGQRLIYRGEAGGMDTYEKPRDVLDFQISKKVFHGAGELRLNVADLLAQPVVYYYKYNRQAGGKTAYSPAKDKIVSSLRTGNNISLSFKYNFFSPGNQDLH